MNAVLVVDKPKGITSHDVVARVRRILQEKSVGHLGTLDPLATGVLPLLVGKYTRLAQFFVEGEKVYEGVIRFGFATDTYDADGEPTGPERQVELPAENIQAALEVLVGEIEQVPPPFSAKQVGGVRAYKLAREKTKVELRPVRVTVRTFEVLAVEKDRVRFSAVVSPGTYIRSLAHDLGRKLGCGAHLAELRRTASGEFRLQQAISLQALEQRKDTDSLAQAFIPPREFLKHLPLVIAMEDQAAKIRNGNAVNLADFSGLPLVKVLVGNGDLIAIVARVAGTLFQPKVVLS